MVKDFEKDLLTELDGITQKLASSLKDETTKEKIERLQNEMKQSMKEGNAENFVKALVEWRSDEKIGYFTNNHINIAGTKEEPLIISMDLSNVPFDQFNFSNVKFKDCNLENTGFNKCKFENVEMSGTLTKTKIIQGTINGLKINGVMAGIKIYDNIVTGDGLEVTGQSKILEPERPGERVENNYIGSNLSLSKLKVNVTLQQPFVASGDNATMKSGEFRIKDNLNTYNADVTFKSNVVNPDKTVTEKTDNIKGDKMADDYLNKVSLNPRVWDEKRLAEQTEYPKESKGGAGQGYAPFNPERWCGNKKMDAQRMIDRVRSH